MLTIGQTAKGIVSVLNPPSSKGARATKERSLTLVPTKGKRSSTLFTGFNTSRPRSTTATNRWQKAGKGSLVGVGVMVVGVVVLVVAMVYLCFAYVMIVCMLMIYVDDTIFVAQHG